MIRWQPPQSFLALGNYEIRTYGILLSLAIISGYIWAEQRARKLLGEQKYIHDVFFWAIIGGIIGARLGFIIQDVPVYIKHPAQILAIWNGGLSFHGAILGGVLAGVIALSAAGHRSKFWTLADAAAGPILLGAVIGRLGNWANQELYGYPTSLPWGIEINPIHRLPGFEAFEYFHPTFAYELVLNSIGLAILLLLIEKRQKRTVGQSFFFVIGWYSFARGVTEIWRISDRILGPLSLAQVLSFAILCLAAIALLSRSRLTDQKKSESITGSNN